MRFLRLLLFITVLYPIHAQTIGGGTCTKSTLNGTFFYLLDGTVVSQGVGYAYAELGKLSPMETATSQDIPNQALGVR